MKGLVKGPLMTYLAAITTVILWASAFPGVKYALQFYSPEAVMLLRFLVASATLAIIAVIKRVRMPKLRDMPLFIAGGFIGIFLYMWLFNTGSNRVQSGISSFIISAAPIFTTLFSMIFLKEKPHWLTIVGILISAVGLVLIALTQVQDFKMTTGVFLLLAATVSTSIYNIIQRLATRKYSALTSTAFCMFFGTLMMLIFLPQLVSEAPSAPIEANLVVVFLGVFPAAIAYWIWGYALGSAERTTQVTVFLYLMPFLAILIAFIWLGEVVPPLAIVGGLVIIGGMVLANRVKVL